jgi:hypothetical protein
LICLSRKCKNGLLHMHYFEDRPMSPARCMMFITIATSFYAYFADRLAAQSRTPLPGAADRLLNQPRDSRIRTIRINMAYLSCNLAQIHLARSEGWRRVYRGLGAGTRALRRYEKELEVVVREGCASRHNGGAYRKAKRSISKFFLQLDNTAARQLGTTANAVADLRRTLIDRLHDEFNLLCMHGDVSHRDLLFGRLPFSPDIGLGSAVLPLKAALGKCGPKGAPTAGNFDLSTYRYLSAFRKALAQCHANLLTVADECDSPVGQGSAPSSPEEAAEQVVATCAAANTSCTTTEKGDGHGGKIVTVAIEKTDGEGVLLSADIVEFRYDRHGNLDGSRGNFTNAEGNRVSVIMDFGQRPDELQDSIGAAQTEARAAEQAQAAAAQQRTAVVGVMQNVFDSLVAHQNRAVSNWNFVEAWVYREKRNQLFPGGRPVNQCETLGGQQVRLPSDAHAQSGGGGRIPKLRIDFQTPRDMLAYCMCESGQSQKQRYGKIGLSPLGGDLGRSCGANFMKRNRCLRKEALQNGIVDPECQNEFIKERGSKAIDGFKVMCQAVIQCPPNSTVAVGQGPSESLRCGCGRNTGGGGRSDPCRTVSCPPTGRMSGQEEQCCARPSFPKATPRLRAILSGRQPFLRRIPGVKNLRRRQ